MTSRNGGNGFSLPLSMLLPPLAVLALRHYRVAVAPVTVLVVAIAALNLAASSSLWSGLAEASTVSVPGYGEQAWVNGTPRPVGAIRVQVPGPATRFVDGDRRLAGSRREAGERPPAADLRWPTESGVVAFASRNRAISSNSVGLALLLNHRTVDPVHPARSRTERHGRQLREAAHRPRTRPARNAADDEPQHRRLPAAGHPEQGGSGRAASRLPPRLGDDPAGRSHAQALGEARSRPRTR